MTTKSRSSLTLERWAAQHPLDFQILPHDATLGVATLLAVAYNLLRTVDQPAQGRRLVFPHLEQAWDELLYLRSQQPGSLDESHLTRFGRLGPGATAGSTTNTSTATFSTPKPRTALIRNRKRKRAIKVRHGQEENLISSDLD